jgi:hypothetical protein
VLSTGTDATNLLSNTRLHDLTIYVDQSVDVSCSPAEGRAAAGSCGVNRPMEAEFDFLAGRERVDGDCWERARGGRSGNCAIAMPAALGTGGNGLKVAEMENVAIASTGVDPLAAYTQANSTHTCGLYLGSGRSGASFATSIFAGVGTGIAVPVLPVSVPAGLNADSNRWQNVTIQAVHGFVAAAGTNNVVDDVVVNAWNSAATGEAPTGLVLDFAGAQQGWTVRNAAVRRSGWRCSRS